MTHGSRIARTWLASSALVAAIAATAACGGNVTVDGTLGDRALDVAGTGFGWVDLTHYVADVNGGAPILETRATDDVLLHLVFTQATFDAAQDFRALPAGERAAINDDIARGDQMRVDVQRGNVVREGDDLVLVTNDGSLPPEVLPFIASVEVLLGDEAVGNTDRYPDRAPRIGSKQTAKLHLDATTPELVGTLTFTAQKGKGETDGFLEGTVNVHFGFELLPERLAECNFARGDAGVVDPCTLEDNKNASVVGPGTPGTKPTP